MPYIQKKERDALLDGQVPSNAGQLNYMIHRLIFDYINRSGKCYQTLNDVIGVLECVKQELYRRSVAPYEDRKIIDNGEVYPDSLLRGSQPPPHGQE